MLRTTDKALDSSAELRGKPPTPSPARLYKAQSEIASLQAGCNSHCALEFLSPPYGVVAQNLYNPTNSKHALRAWPRGGPNPTSPRHTLHEPRGRAESSPKSLLRGVGRRNNNSSPPGAPDPTDNGVTMVPQSAKALNVLALCSRRNVARECAQHAPHTESASFAGEGESQQLPHS